MKINYKVNESGKDYVGIYLKDNNELQIQLPIGYRYNEEEEENKEFKQDIRKLMKLIAKKTSVGSGENTLTSDFCFISAIKVLENYLQYGLYRQTQKEVKINAKGKVNWRKTINSQKIFYKNKIIYNDIYVNKTNYFAEKEIQEIQKYCLSKISEMIGFMWDFSFSYFNIDYSKAEMIKLLKQELKETNQDIKIEILNNLIDFITKTNFEKLKKGNIFIKYKEFQYIWEELVDSIGIKGEEKKEYFPKARYYYLEGQEYKSNVKLQFPDTIINRENLKYIYVLDAKYYPEGSLPEEYSIFKQIRYGQHVNKIKQKEVINAFVLPKKLEDKNIEINIFGRLLDNNTESELKSYEKIYVVYVDTKRFISKPKEILQEIIEELNNCHERHALHDQ